MATDSSDVRPALGEAIPWRRWSTAAVHALPASALVLALLYRWFAVADRYAIFLYGHLGATPFDRVTSSRYWMAGLVASGIVMLAYLLVNWAAGRVARLSHRAYAPPAWWRVWALCAPASIVGIPLITTRVNAPTLPPDHAAACVAATLIGLALALMPGSLAAQRPADLIWTALHGLGLMPALLLVRTLELPGQGLISPPIAYAAALGGTLAGAIWLALAAAVQTWRQGPSPTATAIFVAGLDVSYLLLPVVHHVLATPPGYRYISTSSNFFADHVGLQLLALSVAALLALGVTRLPGGYRVIARCARERRLYRGH